MKDNEWYVWIVNANDLVRLEFEKAVEPLTEVLRDDDWELRLYADEALEAIQKESPQQ